MRSLSRCRLAVLSRLGRRAGLRHTDRVLAVPVGAAELEHRIVGEVGQRERRDVPDQRPRLDVLRALDHRPLALALPQRDPMLNDLGLFLVDIERLLQGVFGGGVIAGALEHPAQLLQGDELVLDGVAVDAGQAVDERQPLGNGGGELAAVLQRPAEVDVGGVEVRLEPGALAQGVDRAGVVAQFRQGHAVVEIDGVEELVGAVARDPGLVEIGGLLWRLQFLELLRLREQVDDRQLLHGTGPVEDRGPAGLTMIRQLAARTGPSANSVKREASNPRAHLHLQAGTYKRLRPTRSAPAVSSMIRRSPSL